MFTEVVNIYLYDVYTPNRKTKYIVYMHSSLAKQSMNKHSRITFGFVFNGPLTSKNITFAVHIRMNIKCRFLHD